MPYRPTYEEPQVIQEEFDPVKEEHKQGLTADILQKLADASIVIFHQENSQKDWNIVSLEKHTIIHNFENYKYNLDFIGTTVEVRDGERILHIFQHWHKVS